MVFISPKKLFSFWKYLNFCPDFFSYVGKRLDEKVKFNFKVYDVANWEQTITMHILPNISRNKRNKTTKFGQLIEYNIRNIFHVKM